MNPSTREEQLMRGISNVLQGNDSGVDFTPSSRTEILLNEILTAASGGGGGGGALEVVFTYDTSANKYVCNKTYTEINTAKTAKTPISAVIINRYGVQYKVSRVGEALGGGIEFLCSFAYPSEDGDYISLIVLTLSSNDSVTASERDIEIQSV